MYNEGEYVVMTRSPFSASCCLVKPFHHRVALVAFFPNKPGVARCATAYGIKISIHGAFQSARRHPHRLGGVESNSLRRALPSRNWILRNMATLCPLGMMAMALRTNSRANL